LKTAKTYFIEAKIYNLIESVIPHQNLFQHQLGYVWPKFFTQKVTNITFIFDTSPITKPKEKKVGEYGILCPPHLRKWRDTSPVSLNKLRPWLQEQNVNQWLWIAFPQWLLLNYAKN